MRSRSLCWNLIRVLTYQLAFYWRLWLIYIGNDAAGNPAKDVLRLQLNEVYHLDSLQLRYGASDSVLDTGLERHG